VTQCNSCGYEWEYRGIDPKAATCPRCKKRVIFDTPLDEPEGGDLVELLGRRGQSEALEQLPDRFIRDYMEERNGQHS